MLSNEVFAIDCRRKYEAQGIVVDKTNGQFAHCPYPKSMGDSGYYLLWGDHQHQGLLQSKDVGRRCFFTNDTKLWLDTFPSEFFELYDIYQEFLSGKHNSMFGKKGELNPLFGKTGELHPNYGKPNPGVSISMKGKTGELHPSYGKKNSFVTEQNKLRVGELNPTYNTKWWVNETGETCREFEPPGPDWQRGMKWKVR